MKVIVYYQSGLIDVFDSTNFTNSEPYSKDGCSVMTEFALRLDLLEKEGLVVDVFTYDRDTDPNDPKVRIGTTMVPYALRRNGNRLRLVSLVELKDIAKITLDGELVVWRQGTELINAVKFSNQELLCFSNVTTTSINQKASSIFRYLKNANPDMEEGVVANMMGYTLDAIRAIQIDEAAQNESDDEDGKSKEE